MLQILPNYFVKKLLKPLKNQGFLNTLIVRNMEEEKGEFP